MGTTVRYVPRTTYCFYQESEDHRLKVRVNNQITLETGNIAHKENRNRTTQYLDQKIR